MSTKRRPNHSNPAKGRPARGDATKGDRPKGRSTGQQRAGSSRPARKPSGQGLIASGFGFGQLGRLEVAPEPGSLYPQLLRRTDERPAQTVVRSVVGVLAAIALYVLVVTVVSQGLLLISWAITSSGSPFGTFVKQASAFELPAGLLATNLGIACLIPISFAVLMIVHQRRARWLGSVRPRLRWRYLFVSLGIAAVSLLFVFLLSTLVGPGLRFHPQQHFWWFLIIIVLTSPLQAAGEEYLFRGYLLQAFGSMVRTPWFGIVVSSLVFAAFHGLQNPPLFLDRFAFGLLAAILVTKTGGIEAGIAAHVINNIYAWGLAGLTTSIAQAHALTKIGWLDAAFDVGGFALFAVLAYLAARLLKVATRTS